MPKRDGKAKFYRYLDLDMETKKILKWYGKAVDDLKNDREERENNDVTHTDT